MFNTYMDVMETLVQGTSRVLDTADEVHNPSDLFRVDFALLLPWQLLMDFLGWYMYTVPDGAPQKCS